MRVSILGRTVVALCFWPALPAQPEGQPERKAAAQTAAHLGSAAWRTREVAVGVSWRQARLSLFGGPQQVSVLSIRRHEPDVRLRVAAPPAGLAPTSDLAQRGSAAAAVNGGFFAKDGTADGLLVIGGTLRRVTDTKRPAALTVRGQQIELVETAGVATESEDDPIDALAAGPWLVRDGLVVTQAGGPRHPRTAIGTDAGTTFLVTVDGRAEQARGVTMHELAQLMLALGSRDAFNLDGGGSTTMWVASLGGVVNCPCDNKTFDPAGERAVSNSLLVLGRAIWTQDEELALLEPSAAFTAAADAVCVDGDYVVAERGGSATFDFASVPLTRATIEVFTRAGDKVAWSVSGREGKFAAQQTGWLALDDFAWGEGEDRKLTLRSESRLRVDAVRVVSAPE